MTCAAGPGPLRPPTPEGLSHCTQPPASLLTQSNPVQSLYLCHLQKQGAEDYQGIEQAALGWVSSYPLSSRYL